MGKEAEIGPFLEIYLKEIERKQKKIQNRKKEEKEIEQKERRKRKRIERKKEEKEIEQKERRKRKGRKIRE